MRVLHCHSERSEDPTIEALITQGCMRDARNLCEVLRFTQDDNERANAAIPPI
jgi:hypothetical protein